MTKPSVDDVMRLADEYASDAADLRHAQGIPRLEAREKKFTDESRAALESAIRSLVERPASEPHWIVNDLGELGVYVNGRCFFLYKGENIEYKEGTHDDGSPMLVRMVGKREFGETQWPDSWLRNGRSEDRYTLNLTYTPGLSFGKPEDADWKPINEWRPAND